MYMLFILTDMVIFCRWIFIFYEYVQESLCFNPEEVGTPQNAWAKLDFDCLAFMILDYVKVNTNIIIPYTF